MTKRGETTNMEVIDFIEAIERYIDPVCLDYVIVNNGHIDKDIVTKYKKKKIRNLSKSRIRHSSSTNDTRLSNGI